MLLYKTARLVGQAIRLKRRARCWFRTCKNRIQHQQLTSPNPQIDPQISDINRQQLAQLLEAWPNLPTALKAAIIAIVESSERD